MAFKFYFLNLSTGDIGAPIEPESGGSFTIPLNGVEELSFTVQKKDLKTKSFEWYTPPQGGVLLTHTAADGAEHPIIAGYVQDWGKETMHTLELKVKGIREIFENRTIWEHLEYRGTTLGNIAWELCKHAMDRPGGYFPIRHKEIPGDTGQRERTYEKWNVSNNMIGKRWKELSEVIGGPDIMIRPAWANEQHTKIEWHFCHGGEAYPFIPQTWVPDFDTTAPQGLIEDVSINSTGKDIIHRVWCTGSGEGEGKAIGIAEDLTSVFKHRAPFLEAVITDSDQSELTQLTQKAWGALRSRQVMTDQVTLSFLADNPKTPLGSFHVGDVATVTTAGWFSIPDGTRRMRIIKLNGSLDGKITIDFQAAQW